MKITIPREKRPLKLKSVKVSAKNIEAIIQQEVAESLEHFNDEQNGGWKLDKSYLKSNIFCKVFGVLIESEIDQAFINAGLSLSYDSNGSFVELKEGYQPIFFNKKTGKIKLVEDSDNKAYLFKYSENKGWTYIGRL
jgi:hypothetical protein